MTIALVDGDAICFIAAASADGRVYKVGGEEFKYKKDADGYATDMGIDLSEVVLEYHPEPEENAYHNAKTLLQRIVDNLGIKKENVCIGIKRNKDNFRYAIGPDYKANRKDVRRPFHIDNVTNYLEEHWWTHEITDDREVDDWLGEYATTPGIPHNDCVIVTHDKDLDMIPGKHYRIMRTGEDRIYDVSPAEAYKFFCKQVLMGDTADNIRGIKGIGPKKADKIIDPCTSDDELWHTIAEQYIVATISAWEDVADENYYAVASSIEDIIRMNARLLWIRRYNWAEYDNPPKGALELIEQEMQGR
jgi:hypothetical protein